MGLAKGKLLPTVDTLLDLVFHADPDVTPHDPADRGWIERTAAHVAPGADVLTVRCLSVDERAIVGDGPGPHQRRLAACRIGIVAVGGVNTHTAIEQWLANVDPNVWYLLGAAITTYTNGGDAQAVQRLMIPDPDRIPLPQEEKAPADDGGPPDA